MTRRIDDSCFMQNNPRYNEREAWTAERFPDAQYHYFRDSGCLVCSLAFLLRYHGFEKETNTDIFNPWTFCERLIENQAFSPGADLEIAAVSRLYPIGYLGVIDYSREALIDSVRSGYACLIVVRGKNGPFHFIVLEELTEDDAIVFDSKAGQRYLSEYAEVYQIRLFRRTEHIKNGAEIIYDACQNRPDDVKIGKIAIGFDDGPSEKITERVLNILKEQNVKASFFVMGELIGKYELLVRRMVRDGHQVGIHGWNHFYLNALNEEECRYSLNKTAEEIRRICEVSPTVLRPPGGYAGDSVLKVAEDLGLAVIGWSVDSGDWWHQRTAQDIVESVLSQVTAGDIILMHDAYSATADALEILIPELKKRGFSLVTQNELITEESSLEPGKVYNWIG